MTALLLVYLLGAAVLAALTRRAIRSRHQAVVGYLLIGCWPLVAFLTAAVVTLVAVEDTRPRRGAPTPKSPGHIKAPGAFPSRPSNAFRTVDELIAKTGGRA